jgi:hypothetical protein
MLRQILMRLLPVPAKQTERAEAGGRLTKAGMTCSHNSDFKKLLRYEVQAPCVARCVVGVPF